MRLFHFGDDFHSWVELELHLHYAEGVSMGKPHVHEVWKRRHGDKATPLAHKVMANESERFMKALEMPRTKDGKRYAPKKQYGNAAWRSLEERK